MTKVWGRLENVWRLVSYSVAPRGSVVYSGFDGYHNLGDEVLVEAIRKAFGPHKFYSPPQSVGKLGRSLTASRRHALAILGGGTLIGNNLADGSNPFRERFSELRKRADRAVVFGTGVGAISADGAANAWLLEWKPLLESCSYIGVRGPESVHSLASIGIRAEMLGDAACVLAADPGYWSPAPKALGVNIGAIRDAAALETVNGFVAAKMKEGWRPTFFVVSPEDVDLVRESLERLGAPGAECRFIYTNGGRYLEAVRSMTAFVGIRLHSVILAMCAGVPSIMLAYAPKCHDFMISVDMEELAIDIKELSMDVLSTRFEHVLSGQQQIGAKIARQMTSFRDRQVQKASELRSLVDR